MMGPGFASRIGEEVFRLFLFVALACGVGMCTAMVLFTLWVVGVF